MINYPVERWTIVENNGDLGNPRVFRPSSKPILTLEGEYLVDVVKYSECMKFYELHHANEQIITDLEKRLDNQANALAAKFEKITKLENENEKFKIVVEEQNKLIQKLEWFLKIEQDSKNHHGEITIPHIKTLDGGENEN